MSRELAYIHPNAQIASSAKISPFVSIDEDVVIGENTWIGPNAVIMNGARIGANCKIYPGAVISANPQDLKYKDEATTAEIGDNTTIREFVTINKGTVDRNKTSIGKNSLLMAYVHVAHDCIIGNNCIIANSVNLAGHITIEDFAILEGMVGVQQFITIGAHSFIAGASLVRKNVPPYVRAAREPLAYAGVNSIGLQRRGYDLSDIKMIEDIYRILYVQNANLSKGIAQVEESIPENSYKKQILDFISASEKGIIKGMV